MSDFAILLLIFSTIFVLKLTRVIKESWWYIIIFVALCLVATYIYYELKTPGDMMRISSKRSFLTEPALKIRHCCQTVDKSP